MSKNWDKPLSWKDFEKAWTLNHSKINFKTYHGLDHLMWSEVDKLLGVRFHESTDSAYEKYITYSKLYDTPLVRALT